MTAGVPVQRLLRTKTMAAKTFSAQVVSGPLRYQELLDAFEGQDVRVTIVGNLDPVLTPHR